jgi:acyl-homoserine lactone acylase PvdQ
VDRPGALYQAQLTIPGKINVSGASLYGVPLILIGHNARVAWSHTVSTAVRFTLYQLTLVPGHPTEYLENGHPVAMIRRTGLNTSNKIVQLALGDAISLLDQDHIPLNTTLGSVQYVTDHGTHIPIPGGPGDPDGIFNAIYAAEYPGDSQTAPDDGSSFIQVVTWNDTACPVAATILTYSESSNPASPHHTDQTRLFSRKQWLPDRFCPAQIMADPQLQVTRLTG